MYLQKYQVKYSQEIPDVTLVQQICVGNHLAFETLFYRYHAALYNFVGRRLGDYEQAHDVVQFVFLQLFVSIPKLSKNLSSQRSRTPLKSWLFQVAGNRCVDELRKKRPLLFSDLEQANEEDDVSLLDAIQDPYPLPEEIAEQHTIHNSLYFAIQALPHRFRSVVLLRYTEDLTFGEIGRRLNMPENTAKTYFQRARPLLRATLAS